MSAQVVQKHEVLDHFGSANDQNRRVVPTPTKASFLDVYLLGLAIKLGGCVASWHNGFSIGFWPYFTCFVIVALGYLAMISCIAEMISVISFPGGYFGYVRCGVGPLLGFLVGCSGMIESIFFLAVSVLKISQAITIAFDLDTNYQPIFWFITYGLLIMFHVRGNRLFWQTLKAFTAVSLILILLYLFGSIPSLSYLKNIHPRDNSGFHVTAFHFLHVLRLPGWFFMGIDMVSLTVEEVHNEKEVVPWSMIGVICTMIVLACWLFFTVPGQAPGLTDDLFSLDNIFPLSPGFSRLLNISQSSAAIFAVLPLFSSCIAYMFVVGRQLNSMARSGLFPPFFKATVGVDKVPFNAMFTGALCGILGLFFAWEYDPYTMLFRLSMLGGSFVYVNMFICFLVFKSRYGEMARGCKNPCGYFSSIFSIAIFGFVFIALARDSSNVYIVTAYVTFMVVMWLYYYAYAEAHQFFSEKEQTVFLKAYIVNLNRRKKMAMTRKMATDIMSVYNLWMQCEMCSRFSANICVRMLSFSLNRLLCFCCCRWNSDDLSFSGSSSGGYQNQINAKRSAVYIQQYTYSHELSNKENPYTNGEKYRRKDDDDYDEEEQEHGKSTELTTTVRYKQQQSSNNSCSYNTSELEKTSSHSQTTKALSYYNSSLSSSSDTAVLRGSGANYSKSPTNSNSNNSFSNDNGALDVSVTYTRRDKPSSASSSPHRLRQATTSTLNDFQSCDGTQLQRQSSQTCMSSLSRNFPLSPHMNNANQPIKSPTTTVRSINLATLTHDEDTLSAQRNRPHNLSLATSSALALPSLIAHSLGGSGFTPKSRRDNGNFNLTNINSTHETTNTCNDNNLVNSSGENSANNSISNGCDISKNPNDS